MSEQLPAEKMAVTLDEDQCSRCTICSALCPYEALKKDTEQDKVFLDIEKCQVCGLCYSNCPSQAIDTIYYDMDSLTRYLERARQEYESDTLVIMCKGSAPDFSGVEELFGVTKFIPLTVPCVGRIPGEVLLQAILMGIKEIYVLACDEDYCRFQRGSLVAGRKIWALNLLLEQLGYGKEIITLKRRSLKVKVDADRCIACGNCVYYCPYNAASLGNPGAVSFDLAACRGCGLCVAMCPAFALDLEHWERDRISESISRLSLDEQSPNILLFRCQWAVFPSLNEQSAPNIHYIDLPCAARVDIYHILEAFQKGVDGVMIAACSEEDCKQEKASGKTQRSIAGLMDRLGQIGLQDRLHFCTVSPRYPEGFTNELEQFGQGIAAVGSREGK